MKIAVCILALVYGSLSILAPVTQLKNERNKSGNITMLTGGIVFTAAAILEMLDIWLSIVSAVLGAVLICSAAICNGLKNGKVHIQHHIVRFALSAGLIVGFVLL